MVKRPRSTVDQVECCIMLDQFLFLRQMKAIGEDTKRQRKPQNTTPPCYTYLLYVSIATAKASSTNKPLPPEPMIIERQYEETQFYRVISFIKPSEDLQVPRLLPHSKPCESVMHTENQWTDVEIRADRLCPRLVG